MVVSSGAWLDLDLLRQRREQFSQQRVQVVPVRTLLLRGALFGAACPVLLVLICLWLWFSESRLRQQAVALQPLEDEHDRLQGQIQTETLSLEAAVQINQATAQSMADVRSSSAVLADLRRLAPTAVNFDQVRINGDSLELSGEALEPNGLRTINALMLSLGASALFADDQVLLKEARLLRSGDTELAGDARVSYALTASFAEDAAQAIRPQLAELGAVGLEWRLRRIEQERGLLP